MEKVVYCLFNDLSMRTPHLYRKGYNFSQLTNLVCASVHLGIIAPRTLS